jgi:hypothetical protein
VAKTWEAKKKVTHFIVDRFLLVADFLSRKSNPHILFAINHVISGDLEVNLDLKHDEKGLALKSRDACCLKGGCC